MSGSYRCPHCRALLNPGERIILVAEHGADRVLTGFHREPGNYEIWFPGEVELEDGQLWDFSCPVCHGDLRSDDDEELCALIYVVDHGEAAGQENVLLFSRVAGQQATYVVIDGEVSERFGRDADSYFAFEMAHHPPL